MPPTFRPGQPAPKSGIYNVTGPRGGKTTEQVVSTEHHPLPPTPKPARDMNWPNRLITNRHTRSDPENRAAEIQYQIGARLDLRFRAPKLQRNHEMKNQPPWKQSHRSIPSSIAGELARIPSDVVIVAATKKIPVSDIVGGLYAHLGLLHDGSALQIADSVLPPATVGRFSYRNLNGWEVKRTDLPMITKSYSWETPNFGDGPTYGYHTTHRSRMVYQLEFFEPRFFPIKVELLNSPGVGTALVKFEVDQLLDRRARGFDDEFLFCLNLLQENAGVSGVFASGATSDDFIGTVHLDWEVFPPGNAAQLIASLTKGHGRLSSPKTGHRRRPP